MSATGRLLRRDMPISVETKTFQNGLSKRTPNPTAASLLGFLLEGPMTGWDIVAAVEGSIGYFWNLTRSQVYRELPALAEAGIELVGENRAQDLVAKAAAHPGVFRWHFIGRLQSRKTKIVNRICELVHSLDSLSAAKRLSAPALVEVNLAGEETKSGIAPDELPAFLTEVRELGVEVRGLMTMPPLADDPEASRPYFRSLRELADEHRLAELSMGTTQDYRVAVEEGATMVRVGSGVFGR